MGCSQGQLLHPLHEADPRVPLTPAQLAEVRAFWKSIKKSIELTSKDSFIRFLRYHPYFQLMFDEDIRNIKPAEMRTNAKLDAHALAIFTVFDDVIENVDKDMDGLVDRLTKVAQLHANLPSFHGDFFKYMEEPFIESLQDQLQGVFTENLELLYRNLFHWVVECLSLESETIEYTLLPGD